MPHFLVFRVRHPRKKLSIDSDHILVISVYHFESFMPVAEMPSYFSPNYRTSIWFQRFFKFNAWNKLDSMTGNVNVTYLFKRNHCCYQGLKQNGAALDCRITGQ